MQGRVLKEAKRAARELRGGIDIDTLSYLIQTKGFTVLSYNPNEGHPVLEWLGLLDYSNSVRAFTYIGDKGRYVFVKSAETLEIQLHSLAHEAGHIILGHIGQGRVYTKTRQEMEAEAFAYCLLCCRHIKIPFGMAHKFISRNRHGYAMQ